MNVNPQLRFLGEDFSDIIKSLGLVRLSRIQVILSNGLVFIILCLRVFIAIIIIIIIVSIISIISITSIIIVIS